MKKILFAVYLLAAALSVQAGGFQVNTQGQKALGMGGAFTAYSKDASAAYFNPAAMAMLDSGRFISIGSTMLMPKTSFLSNKTGQVSEMEAQQFFPSYLYLAIPVGHNFTAGLSVNSPYGLGTKWQDNWEGSAVSQEINLKTFYVQPTVAYQINKNFSLGAGLVYAFGDVLVRKQLGEINANAKLTGQASGFGFNAGIFGKVEDALSFGVTYRSNVKFNLDKGKATFNNIPATLASQFPNQNFNSELNLPSTLSVGVANRITNKILLAFEFNLTGWSSYDSLNFNFDNATTPDTHAGRRYEDAMAFRIGSEYQTTDKLALRAGIFFDETPVRDEYISPDLPDGSRLGLSAGVSYKISEHFDVDAAYMFEKVADRSSKVDISNTNVSNIAGTYRTLVSAVGLGLNYKF